MPLDPSIPLRVLNPGDFQKMNDAHDAAELQKKAAGLQILKAQTDAVTQRLSATNDQASWTATKNWAKQNGIDTTGIPDVYDPQVKDQIMMSTLSVGQRIQLQLQEQAQAGQREDKAYGREKDAKEFGLKERELAAKESANSITPMGGGAWSSGVTGQQLPPAIRTSNSGMNMNIDPALVGDTGPVSTPALPPQLDASALPPIANNQTSAQMVSDVPFASQKGTYITKGLPKGNALRMDGSYAPIPHEGAGNVTPFAGTSMEAQYNNILLTGDPSTPVYKAAYLNMAKPKVQVSADGTQVITQPDMSAYKAPVGTNQSLTNNNGVNTETTQIGGTTVSRVQGNAPSQAERGKLRELESESATLINSLNQFKDTVNKSTGWDSMSAASGGYTAGGAALNTDWTNAALLAKGDALYKLGVLSGPDLSIIRNSLPDPSTFRGAAVSKEAYNQSINKVINLVRDRTSQYQKNINNKKSPAEENFNAKKSDPLGLR